MPLQKAEECMAAMSSLCGRFKACKMAAPSCSTCHVRVWLGGKMTKHLMEANKAGTYL